MGKTPAHDFLEPRIEALLEAAAAQGIDRDTAVAVLIDILSLEVPLAQPGTGA